MVFDPLVQEALIQKEWLDKGAFSSPRAEGMSEMAAGRKFYALVMLPYPSGKIHMGHVRNYTLGDVAARFHRMRGAYVCQPLGWDAFGLPAENAAIQHGTHPAEWTKKNISEMKGQILRMGISYDWDREIATCLPDYYRWNQWLFTKMWERGDVFRAERNVNWCEALGTVLANEQVVDGRYERTGDAVTQVPMEQYFLKITKYAEELLKGLDGLDWPENVKAMQRHWIGRSEGARVRFEVARRPVASSKLQVTRYKSGLWPQLQVTSYKVQERPGGRRYIRLLAQPHSTPAQPKHSVPLGLEVFTTRLDTLFGVSFMALSTEHPLTVGEAKRNPGLKDFCSRIAAMGREERLACDVKEGYPTGIRAVHPFTGAEIPVFAANYVLMDYGTGAVMGVPAHDLRDREFALKYGLPITKVIESAEATEKGTLINSGRFDGMGSDEAAAAMVTALGDRAEVAVTYKLRDWGLSRQRYWGTPVPTVHCGRHGVLPVRADELPVALPEDVLFTGVGPSPLTTSASFLKATCPVCGGAARRETDTMDTFVDSSWYFLRYLDPKNTETPFSKEEADAWMPVDLYIGGIEHATAHLVYARYFHKVLRDLGMVSCDEPFKKLICQGMVLKDGHKMSKSKGNTVDPDDVIARYGADALRVFIAFAAPIEKEIDWTGFEGIEGASRFLKRAARLVEGFKNEGPGAEVSSSKSQVTRADSGRSGGWHPKRPDGGVAEGGLPAKEKMTGAEKTLMHRLNTAIRHITDDLGTRCQFNTVVSSLMELANDISALPNDRGDSPNREAVLGHALSAFVRMLSPVAPHLGEHLWAMLGGEGFCMHAAWPEADAAWFSMEEQLVVVQINGRVRGRVTVPSSATDDERVAAATSCPEAQQHLAGKTVKKAIVPPGGKLVSLVIG